MRDLKIGIGITDFGGGELASMLDSYVAAEREGFDAAWIPNIFGMDAITLAALAGQRTERIELGTAVVPSYSRHPFYMAQQAASTQAATGGRFVLGIGPSHQVVIENMLGLSYEKPARHTREFLSVLKPLLDDGKVSFEGETYRVNASLNVRAEPCPVIIGALGPVMRRIAGTLADGTITWMTGPKTLAETIVPDVSAHAQKAGRAAPRVVAGFPISLTDDVDGAREQAAKAFAMYGTLPSYQAMLAAEGASGPADVAILGDEATLEAALRRLADGGVTDFNASVFSHGPDAREAAARTRAFLASLASAS